VAPPFTVKRTISSATHKSVPLGKAPSLLNDYGKNGSYPLSVLLVKNILRATQVIPVVQIRTSAILSALAGKIYCNVDADAVPIYVGNLLTASADSGHAMKASDPLRAFGSVIGKALLPMVSGQGLLPILFCTIVSVPVSNG
jgi:hypothetical protein